MGDRTTVTLTILEDQDMEALGHFSYSPADSWADGTHCVHEFHDVNYGTLDFLPKLKAAGIAYNAAWERGNEYGPGTKSLRFDPSGDPIEKEIYDSEQSIDVFDLLQLIDKPEELRHLIVSTHEQVTTLPWDNQELYGRRYRTKQLITTK